MDSEEAVKLVSSEKEPLSTDLMEAEGVNTFSLLLAGRGGGAGSAQLRLEPDLTVSTAWAE